MRRRAITTISLMAALLAACAPGVSFTPGTAQDPRPVMVSALDTNRFVPDHITVRAGETVVFVVSNEGALEHEFVIGSRQVLLDHSMTVTHGGHFVDSVNEIRLIPGQTKELTYTFDSSTHIGYACFMRSHFPAAMSGSFDIIQ